MKIIHTGDWHIGKLVHGVHMTEDQKFILDEFKVVLEEEKPEVLIISGDIYDRSVPPVEAVELLDDFLSYVSVELGIKILAIAGNHDSPDRLSFGNRILEKKGVYIRGDLDESLEPIVMEDQFGKINFYLIPYAEPVIIRNALQDESIRTYDDVYRVITKKIYSNMNKSERNVAVAHAFLGGSVDVETSESERRLSIGGSDIVDVEYFKEFDYTALGHIHKPQKVRYENIRYAGSLLKYSFSEHNQKKSITVLEFEEKGEVKISQRYLLKKRDMRQIRGTLDELVSEDVSKLANRDDYIMAVLTDQGEVVDAIGKLRRVYPNVLRLERDYGDRTIENERTSAGEEFVKRSPLELFQEFYENIVGKELVEENEAIVKEVIAEIAMDRREVK